MAPGDRLTSELPGNPTVDSATLLAIDAAPATAAPQASSGPVAEKVPEPERKPLGALSHDYKGFVAGVFSGVAKLTGVPTRSSSWQSALMD